MSAFGWRLSKGLGISLTWLTFLLLKVGQLSAGGPGATSSMSDISRQGSLELLTRRLKVQRK